MRAEIAARVRALGVEEVDVPVVLDPPWSSDRIAPAARERMKAIGLAPPAMVGAPGRFRSDADLMVLSGSPGLPDAGSSPSDDAGRPPAFDTADEVVACPFCGSENTTLENAFGPTICRAIYYCQACQQPFELFKGL